MRDASSGEFKSDTGPPRYLVTSACGSRALSLDRWTINRPLSIIHAGNYFFRPFYRAVSPWQTYGMVHLANSNEPREDDFAARSRHNKLREDINHSPAAWIKLSSRDNRFVTAKLNAAPFKREEGKVRTGKIFFFIVQAFICFAFCFQISGCYFAVSESRQRQSRFHKSLRFPIEENRWRRLLQSIPRLIARDAVENSRTHVPQERVEQYSSADREQKRE